MSVSVAIQAHPMREEMVERLANECLGGRAEVVYDPDPYGTRNPWRTYRLALERGLDAPTGTTHRLVVQDDVYVCDHFLEAVEAVAAAQPDRVIVLYVAGHPLQHARRINMAHGWGAPLAELENNTWCPVVATMWPVGLLEPMLSWVERMFAEQRFPPQYTADDEITGRYLRDSGITALATVPSLVEHPDLVYSIASGGRRGGRDRGGMDHTRRALLFVEDFPGLDAREIDWTRGIGPIF